MSVEGVVALITVMIAMVGMIVSVFTLSQSARKDAFAQLQSVVGELKLQLDAANKENARLMQEVRERDEKIDELSQRVDAQDALIAALKSQVEKKKI